MKASFAALFLALVASTIAQKPLVFVVQERAVDFTSRDPNIDVMRPLAAAFENSKKFNVSIYSQGDPLVMAAMQSGEWKKWSEAPKRDDLFALAKVIGADYVIICKALRATGEEKDPKTNKPPERTGVPQQGGLVRARADMFSKKFSPMWNDDTSVSVLVGSELDVQNTALSISNSWFVKLTAGPLKEFAGGTNLGGNDIGTPTVTNSVSQPVDRQPYENGIQALKAKRYAAAITFLRDAVDADPLNAEVRLALIDALRKDNKPFLAADEASRGAALIPESAQLMAAGGAAWLDGNQLDKAYEQLTTSLTKNPDDPVANMLMGDLRIRKLDFTNAIESYDRSLKAANTAEVRFKRSVANALKGDFVASRADLKAATELGLSDDPVDVLLRYQQTLQVIDAVFSSLASTARNLLNEAKTSPNDKTIGNRLAELQSKCTSFMDYVDILSSPPKHTASHASRGLALNLLVQSVQSVQRFLFDKSGDSEQDASLLIIEASREYADAIEKYKLELAKK